MLTPQGAFDLDPEKYIKDHMNEKEFEYKGLEDRSPLKSSERPSPHHKILVKFPLLKKLVEESIVEDASYIPVTGKVLKLYKG